MTTRQMRGEIDNGNVGELALGEFTGRAGWRVNAEGQIEVAFFGPRPQRAPKTATLDGEIVQVVEVRRGDARGASVLIAGRVAE